MTSMGQIIFARVTRVQLILGSVFTLAMAVSYLTRNGDFDVFYAGILRYVEGAIVHDKREEIAFTYPTFLAMVLSPLAILGPTLSRILVFVASLFCFFAGVRLLGYHLLTGAKRPQLVFWISMVVMLRYFLSVFDNQQSDYFVFFLVIVGLHFYVQGREWGVALWAGAALIKTNPLLLVLVPAFGRRWRALGIFVAVVIAGLVLPDLLRPGFDSEAKHIVVPTSVIEREGREPHQLYSLEEADDIVFSHLNDYVALISGSTEKNSWWQRTDNPLNQSLTIATFRLMPGDGSLTWVHFLLWCVFFSVLLFLLASYGKPDWFIFGLLCYAAFVLIGPMSSKPHFIAFYGLILCLWRYLIDNRKIPGMVVIAVLCALFGFTTRGLMGDYAYVLANHSHIGFIGLVFWLWVYVLEWQGKLVRSSDG